MYMPVFFHMCTCIHSYDRDIEKGSSFVPGSVKVITFGLFFNQIHIYQFL